jgi:hypothetical protein
MFPLFCPTLVQAVWIVIFIQKKGDRTLSVFRNIEFSDSIHRPGIKKQTKGNTIIISVSDFRFMHLGRRIIWSGFSLPS